MTMTMMKVTIFLAAVCNDTLGVEVGFVPDDWITVSSHAFASDHGRARLNMQTLPRKFLHLESL